MRKIYFSVLALCMAILVSCSKDSNSSSNGGGGGNTTVGKKISEIYEAHSYIEEESTDYGQTWSQTYSYSYDSELDEAWNWNGDKITSIDYYYESEIYGSDVFTYDSGGNVSKITYSNSDYSDYIKFTYSGSKISKFEIYEDAILDEAWELSYSGNKIIRINCIYLDDTKAKISDRRKSFLKNFHYAENSGTSLQKDGLPYMTLTWTGNNITQIREVWPDEEYTATYSYDSKQNPYYGGNVLTAKVIWNAGITKLSQNNVTYVSNSEGYTYNYSYNYYDNYPMQETYSHVYTGTYYDGTMYRATYTYRYDYTYLTEN